MFKGSQYPDILGKDNNNYYIPNEEIPKQEKEKSPEHIMLGDGVVGGKRGIKYGYIDPQGKEIITKFDEYNKDTVVKIDMPIRMAMVRRLNNLYSWRVFLNVLIDFSIKFGCFSPF